MVCGFIRAVVGWYNRSIGWISTLSVRKSKHGSIQLGALTTYMKAGVRVNSGTGAPLIIIHLAEISFCSLFSSGILTHMQPDYKV